VRGNDRCEVLAPERQSHLRHQAFNLELYNPAHKLVASADLSEVFSALLHRPTLWNSGQKAINLGFRNTMMPTRCFDCLDLALVNPLLQRRVAYTQHFARLAHGNQSWF